MVGRSGDLLQCFSEWWLIAEVGRPALLAHEWHVGRKEQDAKSTGGKAWLDRWLGTYSVSAEGESKEKGNMSWRALFHCFAAAQGFPAAHCNLVVVWSLKILWAVWPKIGSGHWRIFSFRLLIRNLVMNLLSALDSCFDGLF